MPRHERSYNRNTQFLDSFSKPASSFSRSIDFSWKMITRCLIRVRVKPEEVILVASTDTDAKELPNKIHDIITNVNTMGKNGVCCFIDIE